MRRLGGFVVMAAAAALCGCASESGVRVVLEGRVLASPTDTAGVAGVEVEVPLAGEAALTGPDGRFSLTGRVPEGIEGQPLHAAAWFRKAGYADVVHGFTVVPDARTTVVAVMARTAVLQDVEIPSDGTTAGVIADNATFEFRADSLVNPAGTSLAGTVPVAMAGWDASLPPDETLTPPRWDALYPPIPVAASTRDGLAPWLRPVAACQLSLDAGSPSADPGVGVSLISQYADLAFGTTTDDNRLFRVNPETGVFEEQDHGRVDNNGNRIVFGISLPGTWVWAKATDGSCIRATIKVGRRLAPGAHVRLTSIDINDEDEALLDQRIGAEGASFCLNAPVGRSTRLQAFVSGTTGILSTTLEVLSSGGGDCASGCPVSKEILLPCESAKDCDAGETCVEGQCTLPG